MKRRIRIASLQALMLLVCLGATVAQRSGAQTIYCGNHVHRPRFSSLDYPLPPFFVPRRPAWGGHDFRYRVEIVEPCVCTACGDGTDESAQCGGFPYPVELGEEFTPTGFEQIGQIPNDSILDAVPATH